MAKLTVRDLNVRGKRVFVRVDYNVPMEEQGGQMVINDATRIKETLPTLDLLIAGGAKVILAAHLGRPKGKREPSMSLRPVAAKLADLINRPVAFVDDCIGEKVEQTAGLLKEGDILLLENTRYYDQEEANDPAFAEQLAKVADAYVNDAFGAAHRAHASTEGVARVVAKRGGQCAAGLLMERELKFLGDELEAPARPFVVILGGAKVSDKILVIDRLLEKADTILIGGAMAYTFKLAMGYGVGKSLVEDELVATATDLLKRAKDRGVRLELPVDHIVAPKLEADVVLLRGQRTGDAPEAGGLLRPRHLGAAPRHVPGGLVGDQPVHVGVALQHLGADRAGDDPGRAGAGVESRGAGGVGTGRLGGGGRVQPDF